MYIVLFTWIVLTLFICCFWGAGSIRILRHHFDVNPDIEIPVSVVICARNEVENLKSNLPFVLRQEYSNFEVLVVNDHSTDGSEEFLDSLKEHHSHIKVLHLKEGKLKAGKKEALAKGIKAASHQNILLTDADCVPVSVNWIKGAASALTDDEIYIGVGKYKHNYSFTSYLVQWDTFFAAFQYIWYALAGKPYMGVGRNMGYKRELFLRKPKQDHDQLPGGDDDLFMVNMRKSRTVVLDEKDYTTESKPPQSFERWISQKTRHLSTSFYYPLSLKLSLGLLASASCLFYPIALIVAFFYPGPVLILTAIKLYIQYMAVRKLTGKWGMERMGLHFLWTEPLLITFMGLFQLRNLFNPKPKSW